MLLAVGAVYGQQATGFTVSPPNPVAGRPITFTERTFPGALNTIYVYSDTEPVSSGTCSAYFDFGLTPIAKLFVRSDVNGYFTVTLTAGLRAGTYDVVTEYVVAGAGIFSPCNMFTVSPA